jgi:hypothetical protein
MAQFSKEGVAQIKVKTFDETGKPTGEEKLVDEISYKGKKDKGGFDIHHLPNSENFLNKEMPWDDPKKEEHVVKFPSNDPIASGQTRYYNSVTG